MFKEVRMAVPLTTAIEKYLSKELVDAGTDTLQLEDKECPFCGHKDCFKVRVAESATNFKCFSCGEWGSDSIAFYSLLFKVDPYIAARKLASDFDVHIEVNMTTPQKIFELSANYFHNCLLDSKHEILVDGVQYTPMEYQLQKRRHTRDCLSKEMIGWNDGGLIKFLMTFDYTEQEIVDAGLISENKKTGKYTPFLKKGCFIYPHFVKGLVSHFTQKDPLGETPPYQIRNENRLNSHMFYGQDSATNKYKTLVIVEGENDRLSVLEHTKGEVGVLATIGGPSGAQRKWIETNCAEADVITIFDRDDAGDKYRNACWKLEVRSLRQMVVPEPFKDVDEMLKDSSGLDMNSLVLVRDPATVPIEGADVIDGHDVFELNGCYCKTRVSASGERKVLRITNFLIKLRNVFIRGDERSRDIVIIRCDGVKSNPIMVTSDVKVSVHAFKELVANAVDASFYGTETDLLQMWDFVYAKGSDRIVKIPDEVGRRAETGGWLFRDTYVDGSGREVLPDKEGIMWVNGNSVGIKPASINVRGDHDLPTLQTPPMSSVEANTFYAQFCTQFIQNIGDVGAALTMLAWAKSSAFSDYVFNKYGFFPFLFIWGRHGKGKTSVTKWLLELYGMEQIGSSTVPQLVSGVGFTRRLGFYSSLPLLLDEVRADKDTREFYGHFRAWYNRQGRSMGSAKDTKSIVTQDVKANIIFCGQDVFTDPATRSRCVEVQMPTHGRELDSTYKWIESNSEYLRSIGHRWINASTRCDTIEFYNQLQALERQIMQRASCDSRSAKHWAIITFFGISILEEINVQFDMLTYACSLCTSSHEEQKSDDLVLRFLTVIEGLQALENSDINNQHISINMQDHTVFLWIDELIRIAKSRGGPNEGERFSSRAIKAALRDEECFIKEDREYIGPQRTRRRGMFFSTEPGRAPDVLVNIAHYFTRQS